MGVAGRGGRDGFVWVPDLICAGIHVYLTSFLPSTASIRPLFVLLRGLKPFLLRGLEPMVGLSSRESQA